MARLLDARTSQSASYGNTISIPLPTNTPVAIGQVGLNVTGAGETIRVQLSGIAELSFPTPPPFDSVISFSIARGEPQVESLVAYALYSVSVTEANPNAVQVVTIEASDYNVPLPPSNQLIYTFRRVD